MKTLIVEEGLFTKEYLAEEVTDILIGMNINALIGNKMVQCLVIGGFPYTNPISQEYIRFQLLII